MTTWLSDLSANRHIKTYVKDFLDVSGNMTVRQSDDYKWNSYGQLIKGVHEADNLTNFGTSVAIDSSGTTMVVGSNTQDGGNTDTNDGVTIVYRYDETTNLWYQLGDTLTSSSASIYGWAVDINNAGNRVATFDYGANIVEIYDLSGTNWVNIGTITQHTFNQTGASMSGDGNTIAFTNYLSSTQYMYRYDGTTWLAIGTITGGTSSGFAPEFSYDGNRVTYNDPNASGSDGEVKVFDYSGGITWTQVGSTLNGPYASGNFGHSSAISKDGSIVAGGGAVGNIVVVYQFSNDTNDWVQMGSVIVGPNGFESDDRFGYSLALSDDGLTLAVTENSNATSLTNAGALFVYKYINGDWVQQGSTIYGLTETSYLGGTYSRGMDMNGDGTKIVVGGASAFDGDGYAQVFQWSQASRENPMLDVSGNELSVWADAESNPANYRSEVIGSIVESNSYGASVSMNKDGTIMAVGESGWSNNTGRVYIYKYRHGTWELLNGAIIYASLSQSSFGAATALSNDGLTIAIGAEKPTGSPNYTGLVYVYEFVNGTWTQKGDAIEGTNSSESLGIRGLDMNGDGTVVAAQGDGAVVKVFQYSEDTNTWTQMGVTLTAASASGIVSLDEAGTTLVVGDPGATPWGETKIYKFIDGSWTQLGSTIIGEHSARGDTVNDGNVTRVSADGTIVATGSRLYSKANTSADGYARVFKYVEARGDWVQMGRTLYGDAGAGDNFAYSMDMSADGKTLAVGAPYQDIEQSGDGTTYVYKYIDSLGDWMLLGHYHQDNTNRGFRPDVNATNLMGFQTALSGDGTRYASGSSTYNKVVTYNILFEPAFKVTDNEILMNKPTYINELRIPATNNYWATIYIEDWSLENRLYFRTYDNGTGMAIYAGASLLTSDDRIKGDEVLITNATDTLMKLRPQTYKKYGNFDCSGTYMVESGLIAQDIWYNTPELRHLVTLPTNAEPLPLPEGIDTTHDIQNDPDYTNLGWGNDNASVNYTQLISFLIQSNQEQQALIDTQKTQIEDLLTRVTALENPATV
jgi:hypothetical protein